MQTKQKIAGGNRLLRFWWAEREKSNNVSLLFSFCHKSKLFAIFFFFFKACSNANSSLKYLALFVSIFFFIVFRPVLYRVFLWQSLERKWVIELQNGRAGGSWQVALG